MYLEAKMESTERYTLKWSRLHLQIEIMKTSRCRYSWLFPSRMIERELESVIAGSNGCTRSWETCKLRTTLGSQDGV